MIDTDKSILNIDKVDPILLDVFIKYAKENYYREHTIQKILLVKIDDLYGFLHVTSDGERFDSHCEQCQNESPMFFRFAKSKDMPETLHGEIGITKYQKLIDGEMRFYQYNMEILFDLLEL
jgi:hypothetical protein